MSDHPSSPAPSLLERLGQRLAEFAEAADISGLSYLLDRIEHLEARITRLEAGAAGGARVPTSTDAPK